MWNGDLREMVSLERAMRRLRLVLGLFAAIQFWLYVPPPGQVVPFARIPAAGAVIGGLLLLNLVSVAAGTREMRRIRRLGLVQLAGDLLLGLAIVWLFAFDAVSALWALLIVPIISGAYRHQLSGAVWVWVAAMAGYLVREVIAGQYGIPTDPASVTYRLGVLLVVALSIGWMSKSLRDERLRSDRRAELLGALARAGAIAELATDLVLDSVVESLVALGYEASNVALFSAAGDEYRVEAGRGLPAELTAGSWQPVGRLGALVRDSREPVVIECHGDPEDGLEMLAQGGVQVAVAVPVRDGARVVGLMAAGSRQRRMVSEEELEAFGLLADQAGRALANVRRFEAERRSAERHERAALRDELTGLGNRRHANELLRSLEPGDSVVLVDCDHFKSVNDRDGHAGGDAVLVALAQYLREAMRGCDAVARFGGEEFLVVLRGVDGDSSRVARRLVEGWRATRPRTTVSAGLATHRESLAVTLGEADTALYAAKRAGRDCVRVFSEALLQVGASDMALDGQ